MGSMTIHQFPTRTARPAQPETPEVVELSAEEEAAMEAANRTQECYGCGVRLGFHPDNDDCLS